MASQRSRRAAAKLRLTRRAGLGIAALAALIAGTRGTQDAIANGDTRTLTILHTHTKEQATVTFRRNGHYDPQALAQLNWLLRDWRRDEPTKMDPRLFDIVWEVQRSVGSTDAVHVVSAYRAPETNAMLRRRSRGVAKHSQHTQGKAMDFYLPDAPVERVRSIGMRLQRGGVGYYPSAYTPFVHLDAGSVRSWPRMTRDQLARLFPDGRTVHLPADGQPLAGYEEAKAEILSRGGSVAGFVAYADAEAATPTRRRGFWATLFGADDEDSDYLEATGQAPRSRSRPAPVQTAAAYAPTGGGSGNSADMYAVFAPAQPAVSRALTEPRRPRQPETRVAALPRAEEALVDAQPIARAAPQPVARAAEPAPAPASAVARVEEPRPAPSSAVARVEEPRPAPSAAIARMDVPIPLPRPTGLAPEGPVRVASTDAAAPGPRMVWQTGPAGQAGPDGAESRTVSVPLPPRRPDDALPPVALAFAPVPLPPARPTAVASLGIERTASTTRAAPAAGEPSPALRSSPAGEPSSAPRAAPIVTASIEPMAVRAPARPAETAPVSPTDERAALRALFAAAATAAPIPAAPAPIRVAASRSRSEGASGFVADTGPGLNLGFSKGGGELAADRFTGPAVRPLPVRR